MPNSYGSFVWYELMTSDPKAAEAFYRDVVGWEAQAAPMGVPGMEYTLLMAGPTRVAGLMAIPAEAAAMGARPGWIGYVGVESVDAAAAKVRDLGGAIYKEPTDIPGVGRFAVVADPQGATFAMFKWQAPASDMPPAAPDAVGHVGWHELFAGDLEPAFDFYATMFGWTKADAIPMGEMGVYQLFAHDGVPIGGMMTKPAQAPKPYWNYYFNVDSVAAAIERVKRHGADIIVAPMQVPGGSWIMQGRDPQQALFALVSKSA
ncbi:MAG TPA: VOC family protein [Xanthobacteraceae bacterium]|nr:VOC family protein [Xanthobacteraceae bacterium]